jgi:hypothetical protein
MDDKIKCLCGYEAEEDKWSELKIYADTGVHMYLVEDERRYPCIVNCTTLMCPKCGTVKAIIKHKEQS